jgi:hypothetical protein
MTIDLDDIKSRIKRTSENDYTWLLGTHGGAALVAEVERLREMLLNAGWPREAEELAAEALRYERAAVVAWLRENEGYVRPVAWEILSAAADCIERGEHRRKEENP